MICSVNKFTINGLLKKDIDKLQERIDKVDELLKKTTNEKTSYKLLVYKRALQIILVSKMQNKEVDLATINQLINSSALFATKNERSHRECTGPRKR